jgi:transcriptional regulator with XRE-family HTH domain
MTQEGLAESADVSATYISKLEGGRAAPGIDLVDRLAKALGISTTDLMPADSIPDPLPVLKEQARKMVDTLLRDGDPEAFSALNPILALLVEAVAKRSQDRPGT